MPEPCNCPVNKNFDASKTPKKCSCPEGTQTTSTSQSQQNISEFPITKTSSKVPESTLNTSKPQIQQDISNFASSSDRIANINPNAPHMSQSSQNENDASIEPAPVSSNNKNNVNDSPILSEFPPTKNSSMVRESTLNTSKPQNQQDISNFASSSSRTANINPNGPDRSQSNQNTNNTNIETAQVSSNNQNNLNDSPIFTEPWDNCKCNFPEISPICKCSAEAQEGGDEDAKPGMGAIENNLREVEDESTASDKKDVISAVKTEYIPEDNELLSKPADNANSIEENKEGTVDKYKSEIDVPPDISLSTAEDQSSLAENEKLTPSKTKDGVAPETELLSKTAEDHSSPKENERGTLGSSKPEDDVPPDEGEIRETKDKNLELSKAETEDQSFVEENKKEGIPVEYKVEDDVPPETGLSSKTAEDHSSQKENELGTLGSKPEDDVPPDEGEIKETKDKNLELSKFFCSCRKDKRILNNANLNTNPANCERTFIMVKPDGVHRGLIGKIIKRFEQKGCRLVALTFLWPSEELLKKHYSDLSSRPFFSDLIQYMSSGPVVPMVWEGLGIVNTGRSILGATNPADSAAGTLRGDLCIQVGRNICHASDSVESANNEIDLWFTEKELVPWIPAAKPWIYED